MTDVAKVLNIPQKRATQLRNKCYSTIAQLKHNRTTDTIAKAIQEIQHLGNNDTEKYFVGFILGRIIQIESAAQEGYEDYVTQHAKELEEARKLLGYHPEFG